MIKMYLFDTDFIINLVRGDKSAVRFAKKVDEEMAFRAISVVSAHEYLLGVYFSHWKNPERLSEMLVKAESELMRFEIIPYTYEIAKKSAEIDAHLTKSGQTISLADIIIAATAIVHNLQLVTRNVRHFSRISNLKIKTY